MRFQVNSRSAAIALILALAAAGLIAREARSETIIINGLFSAVPPIGRGLNDLAREAGLPRATSYVTPIGGSIAAFLIARRLIANYENGTDRGPHKCVGHSYGAIVCARVSAALWRAYPAARFSYIGMIDGPALPPLFGNVDHVDNIRPTVGSIGAALNLDQSFMGVADELIYDHWGHVSVAWREDVRSRLLVGIRKKQ